MKNPTLISFFGFLLVILSACQEGDPGTTGPLFLLTASPDYVDNTSESLLTWVIALDPDSHEVLAAKKVCAGEITELRRPWGYEKPQIDLALVLSNASEPDNEMVYYRNIPAGLEGSRGESLQEPAPRSNNIASSRLEGVTMQESLQYDYYLLSNYYLEKGLYNDGILVFPYRVVGTLSGNVVLIRVDKSSEVYQYVYQTDASSDWDEPFVFQNDQWIAAEVGVLEVAEQFNFAELSVIGISPARETFGLPIQNDAMDSRRYYYPKIPDLFKEYILNYETFEQTGRWQSEIIYSELPLVAQVVSPMNAQATFFNVMPHEFRVDVIPGTADYSYYTYWYGESVGVPARFKFTMIQGANEDLWLPTNLHWPRRIRKDVPGVAHLQEGEPLGFTLALVDNLPHEDYTWIIESVQQRDVPFHVRIPHRQLVYHVSIP